MKHLVTFTSCLLLTLCAVACGGGEDSGGGSSGGGGPTTNPDPGPRTAPLPSAFNDLDYYFDVELIKSGLNMPAKIDEAPDGRLFVSLLDGDIITIDPTPPYNQTTWASLTVLNGSEQGLLGIAVSPNFTTDNYVFVMACVDNGTMDVQQIIRYEEVGGVGTNPTQIGPDLPTANTHNAGAIKFGNDGTLFVSVGDAQNPNDAQANGELAGRILRFNADGSVPTGNPFTGADEFEWCRGLRNSFGLCVHQGTGALIGTENGPNSNDELNYLAIGKNFEWDTTGIPGAQVGVRIRNWGSVIVPTGVTYHTGNNFPPVGYADNLFICSYEDERIYRFEMDGTPPVNILQEYTFAEFVTSGNTNKPLDIIEAANGDLYVSTFSSIWRIYRR